MNELSAWKNLKSLKKDMANMTYKEKLVHIWTYYKWVLVLVLILIMAVSILLAVVQNASRITLLSGISINVEMDQEGKQFLRDGYLEIIGTGNKKEQVVFSSTVIEDPFKSTDMRGNEAAILNVAALCVNKELDYIIMDQTGLNTMIKHGVFESLNTYYTQEELDAFTAQGYPAEGVQTENEEMPTLMVLDITNCEFIQAHASVKDKVYFVFAVNSQNKDACRDFLSYLLAWKAE